MPVGVVPPKGRVVAPHLGSQQIIVCMGGVGYVHIIGGVGYDV